MMATPVSTEDYFMKEVIKGNKHQTDNKLNKHIDKFVKYIIVINKKNGLERKDTGPKVNSQ